jgi:hypothetical protein
MRNLLGTADAPPFVRGAVTEVEKHSFEATADRIVEFRARVPGLKRHSTA